MAEAYFYSDEVARFQVLLEEVTRAKPGSPKSRFVPPIGDVLDRLGSEFHHVLYGRRGTGKSSLLRRIEADRINRGHLVAWADQETYMELSYPDVLVATLADTFQQFAEQLRNSRKEDKRRGLWRRERGLPTDEVAASLEQAVAQLLVLKHEPSEADIEWTASYSTGYSTSLEKSLEGVAKKGFLGVSAARGRKTENRGDRTTGLARKYTATKAEHLEKAVATYRELMIATCRAQPKAFVILDDFYRLSEQDQPRIAGYFHRVVKDTGVWLKIGSIRYWTRLYAGGAHATGMQAPHDIKELGLDRGLLDFKTSKRFLEEILSALADECEVDVDALFSEGAKDRLVLAAGGVPRDYLGLVSEAISVARSRGVSNKSGTERVIAEDVNEAAGRTVDAKFNDLSEDAGFEAKALRELVLDITNHCRKTESACFLVDFRDAELVGQLNRLQTMRFVHMIDDHETLPDPQSSRYTVYVLDVSQLAAQRASHVDFMAWTKREKRRARKLVFARGETPNMPEPRPAAVQPKAEQLLLDDALAVVDEIDPAAPS